MKVLVLGGGGTLGAFSAGALKALEERGWTPDAFIGSSAGGINLLRFLAGGADAACEFWRWLGAPRTMTRLCTIRGLRHGLLSPAPFHAAVEASVDFTRMLADPRPLSFLVVDLHTGRVRVRGNRTEKSPEALRAVARGAYALPPLLPPVRLDGEMLADGGLLQNAPLEEAVKMGATEIVHLCNVQVLPRAGGFEGPGFFRSSLRYAEIFVRRASNVGFADAQIVDGRFRGVPFLVVAPPPTLRNGALLRWMLPSVNAMQHLVDAGYSSASHALEPKPAGRATSGPEGSQRASVRRQRRESEGEQGR